MAHKHSSQYDQSPDWHFDVWVGLWNIDCLGGKGGEVCYELRKMMIAVCCLLEVRWRGQDSWMLAMGGMRYNLWWSGM